MQPRVAQFARYSHTEMRSQAGMVMFPVSPNACSASRKQANTIALGPQDKDGNPWTPPTGEVGLLHADNPNKKGDPHGGFMGATDPDQPEEKGPTGFLPLDDPGRLLSRYDVPENLWKYWVGLILPCVRAPAQRCFFWQGPAMNGGVAAARL